MKQGTGKRLKRFGSAALGAVVVMILGMGLAAPALAADLSVRLSGDVKVDAGLILDRWRVQLHLGPGEIMLLRPVVEAHLRAGGGNDVSRAVQAAHRAGCRGTCLSEVVHQVNGSMGRGNRAGAAADEVIVELRAVAGQGGNIEVNLRERMKKKHGASGGGRGGHDKPGRGNHDRGRGRPDR